MRDLLMPNLVISGVLLVLTGAPARAENFTGFYAGLNAGTGKGIEPDRGTPGPGFGQADSRHDLPPSARSAAATLRRSERAKVPGAR